jgi:hypothetical protein
MQLQPLPVRARSGIPNDLKPVALGKRDVSKDYRLASQPTEDGLLVPYALRVASPELDLAACSDKRKAVDERIA